MAVSLMRLSVGECRRRDRQADFDELLVRVTSPTDRGDFALREGAAGTGSSFTNRMSASRLLSPVASPVRMWRSPSGDRPTTLPSRLRA